MALEPFIDINQPDPTALRQMLCEPVHGEMARQYLPEGCIDLSSGITLTVEDDWNAGEELACLAADFRRFLTVSMNVPEGKWKLRCRRTALPGFPDGAAEKCRVTIAPDGGLIEAEDLAGLRRALFNLEDEMTGRRFPALPPGVSTDHTTVRVRVSRSPLATYRFGGGWELSHGEDFYPDEYLNALAHCRINGIWVAGLFRELLKSEVLPEISPEVDSEALARLRKLTERAANYGIRVYLFCMEPRSLHPEHPVFAAHPELRGTICGHGEYTVATLCFQQEAVRHYLREALTGVFRAAPKLAGLVQIFAGERATSCRSIDAYLGDGTLCPRCSHLPQDEALAQIINFQVEALEGIAPDARYLAWSYGFPPSKNNIRESLYRSLNPRVIWLENHEHNLTKEFFGRTIVNEEYSLSLSGPSPTFRAIQEQSGPERPEVWAKLQFGATYEFGSLPFMPTPAAAWRQSCRSYPGLILSWIIGGYPDLMLKAAGMSIGANIGSEDELLHRLAAFYYGETHAETAVAAWRIFAEALTLYPCCKEVFYYGPIARSPGYRLELFENIKLPPCNYNWGIDRQRRIQPWYTDAAGWTGDFSAEELSLIFRQLAARWRDGMALLRRLPTDKRTRRQHAAAEALWIIADSTANVYDFYRLRATGLTPATAASLTRLAEAELPLARRMMELLRENPGIGFQAELHYYNLSPEIMQEKITNVTEVLHILNRITNPQQGERDENISRRMPQVPCA
jgi:hypothetical protein